MSSGGKGKWSLHSLKEEEGNFKKSCRHSNVIFGNWHPENIYFLKNPQKCLENDKMYKYHLMVFLIVQSDIFIICCAKFLIFSLHSMPACSQPVLFPVLFNTVNYFLRFRNKQKSNLLETYL